MSDRSFSDEATYKIEVAGHLDEGWASRFDGLELHTGFAGEDTPITVISGRFADQAALHGVLARIRDLGLRILHIDRLENSNGSDRRNQDGNQ